MVLPLTATSPTSIGPGSTIRKALKLLRGTTRNITPLALFLIHVPDRVLPTQLVPGLPAGVFSALILELAFYTISKCNAAITVEGVHARYTDEELEKLGDRSPLFKYAL